MKCKENKGCVKGNGSDVADERGQTKKRNRIEEKEGKDNNYRVKCDKIEKIKD